MGSRRLGHILLLAEYYEEGIAISNLRVNKNDTVVISLESELNFIENIIDNTGHWYVIIKACHVYL